MSKILVLAEKPSVGRDLARVLRCNKKGNGCLEGDKYIVTWALGHLVTLANPEAYDDRFKNWEMETLPMIPDRFKIVVIKSSGKQFSAVKEQINRNDVSEIVIATDAGREGELVARWILDKVHNRKPLKRLWISSVTDKAIKEGFSKLKPGKEYENLYYSAVARAEADWVIGINATRALTCKYNTSLSCGRVQTPTLAMIAKREDEIKNFKPKTYYGISADVNGMKLTWQNKRNNDTKTFNKKEVEDSLKNIKSKDAIVKELNKSMKKEYAPKLYDLTELQRDANKIFGYSAKETLSIMQRLYENYKVLTYPRTDSRYLTDDMVDTLKDRVKVCMTGPYSKVAMNILKGTIKGSKSFVDNSKVSDHHAIIPTEESIVLSKLGDKERKIYDLVIKRFLAVLSKPCEYEEITLKAEIGEEVFKAKGKRIISLGFKEIYSKEEHGEDSKENQLLPDVTKGQILKVINIKETSGETKPPAPFNEGTLLSAMENPAKYMESSNNELAKTLGETGGLGTVATRADIIEKLFNTFLLEKKGKDIYITSKGSQLLNLVPRDLKSPELTAKWEQKLNNISKGKLNKNVFINDMKEYSKVIVNEIKNSGEKFIHENVTGEKCPKCGKKMLQVNTKKGRMLVCQDRQCGERKNLAMVTNSRCPNCHKKLELRGEGDGRIFVCGCGYREKLNSFNERKKKESQNVSKKEAQKYIKKIQKENDEPVNSALAEALAKLNLK